MLTQSLQYEILLCGVTGGALSTLSLHPLDVIKVRLQVSENHSHRNRDVYTNMRDVIRRIYKSRGVGGFYQGVSPNLVGSAGSWGLYFFIYHGLKTAHLTGGTKDSLEISEHLTFATVAGVLTLTIMNPVWVVKTRMILQSNTNIDKVQRYTGLFDGLSKLIRNEKLPGLYKGYIPGLFGVSHGVIQFVSYEKMKEWYYNYRGYSTDVRLSPIPYIAISACSKVAAVSLTYPYQVVRSRLQDPTCAYTGSMDIIRRTAKNEGIWGFYKGIIPNLVRVTPACCITFLCFENLMHFFKVYS